MPYVRAVTSISEDVSSRINALADNLGHTRSAILRQMLHKSPMLELKSAEPFVPSQAPEALDREQRKAKWEKLMAENPVPEPRAVAPVPAPAFDPDASMDEDTFNRRRAEIVRRHGLQNYGKGWVMPNEDKTAEDAWRRVTHEDWDRFNRQLGPWPETR